MQCQTLMLQQAFLCIREHEQQPVIQVVQTLMHATTMFTQANPLGAGLMQEALP